GFAEGYRGQPLAPQVLHQAKRVVIDWHAALFPGSVVPPATLLERSLAEEVGRGASRLADGRLAGVRAAALINGAAAHAVEVDDIYRDGIYHPGAPTIAAALAVAQSRGATGEALLRAVIVGYEVSTRIAEAMGRTHYKYWHNTGTIGCFGAASAEGPDWERALATLGEDFHICRMTFKNHACCGHAFAAIDGALALKEKMSVAAEEIARVRVGGYRATLEVAGIADPTTAAEAR